MAPALAMLCVACGGSHAPTSPIQPTPIDPIVQPPPAPAPDEVFAGAGDIGWCGSPGPEATARLLDGVPGTVFTAGDNAYMSGTPKEFAECYAPSWGRHKSRTYPTPGNHDYGTPGAAGYYEYFGSRAGPVGQGYYGFDLGNWHVVALNSIIPIGSGSAQIAWLQADLAAHPVTCTLAFWHQPLFSSGSNGPTWAVRDAWRILHEFRVDVVVNGDEHVYERFAPQDPDGRADETRGIRQFTIGTGGAPLTSLKTRAPNSEVFIAAHYGVLKLTLQHDAYAWEFLPVGGPAMDSGTGKCR